MEPKQNSPQQGIDALLPPATLVSALFLPAAKANSKEMLPIVDKPLIQYAAEEAFSTSVDMKKVRALLGQAIPILVGA